MNVSVLTAKTIDQAEVALDAVTAGFDPAFQCTPGEAFPALGWLQACILEEEPRHEVSVMTDDDERIVALAVVHLEDARYAWLCLADPCRIAEIYDAAGVFGNDRYGKAWGFVGNPRLHDEVAVDEFTHLDTIMEYQCPAERAAEPAAEAVEAEMEVATDG